MMAKRRKRKQRKRTSKDVPAKGRLRDMADQLWSLAVRGDWNWKCAVCGARKCEAHHLIPRQHERTRRQLINGICLCATHHQFDPNISPHQNAAGWLIWLEEHYSEKYWWYFKTVEFSEYRHFLGTTNADYYCQEIRRLKPYVSDEDYVRVVGVKFAKWLEENE